MILQPIRNSLDKSASAASRASNLLAFCCALLWAACGNPTPRIPATDVDSRPHAAPAEVADAPFQAPGSDGWGKAAGLSYLELVRGGAQAEQRLPLIVMIHGMGDRPGAHWLDVVRVQGPARIVMPQAPKPYYDGYSWFDYRVGDNEPAALARDIAGAAQQLAAALIALREGRPTLGRPIVAGFSQGGMLSNALAVRHPELLALALPIGGMLPEPLWPKQRPADPRNPPIRAMHGVRDDVVPIGPARELTQHLQQLGYDAQLAESANVGHSISPDMLARIEQLLSDAARSAR
jgi:phospholipase/carboxylesterase